MCPDGTIWLAERKGRIKRSGREWMGTTDSVSLKRRVRER